MAREDSNLHAERADFPSTHWSLMQRVGDGAGTNHAAALEQWLRRYMPALQTYLVRAKGAQPEAAEDLLQDFVLEKVIQQHLIAHADRRRGRFRTFLLSVLNNYATSRWRRETAQHRAPREPIVSLDACDASPGPGVPAGPEVRAFERAWAREVLAETVRRMERACEATGQAAMWGIFVDRVLNPTLHQTEPTPYEQLAARHQLRSPVQASNALVTAKRMYVRQLRLVVAEYARDETEVDEEIRHLREILAAGDA
ncbi:MAG: hypothetical protein WD534_06320 [Phycisphaeraceae bacterium]